MIRKEHGQGRATPTYDHELFCTEMEDKTMQPYLSGIKALSFIDFDDCSHHDGEAFLLVREGAVERHTEFYRLLALSEGGSVYCDSGLGHA